MNVKITHAFKTQALLFTGLVGFAVGTFLLFNPNNEYHDIVFHPKAIADTLLARKQHELFPNKPDPDSILIARNTLKKIRHFDEIDTPFPTDFNKLDRPRPLDTLRQKLTAYLLYIRLQQERHRIEDQADTSYYSRYLVGSLFTTQKGTLARLYSDTDTSAEARTFTFRYDRDTAAPEYSIRAEGKVTLDQKTYPAMGLTFFARYPGFGTFALLMIFQFVAFFIVIPLSVMTIFQLRASQGASKKDVAKAFVIAFLVVFAYAGIIFIFIVTPSYITNTFFMKGFTTITWTYYILAYLSGIACYAGYLFTGRLIAEKMESLKDVATTQRNNFVQQKALTNAARPFADAFGSSATPEAANALGASFASTTHAIADAGKEIAGLADTYKKLRGHFTLFFYTSAFLLSMIVLETGSLFSAIDSLDLVRFLNAPPSYSLLRNDFVYLLGGLYSIMLLIFYVPVKITMVSLENQLPDTKISGDDDKSWLPVFSSGLRTTASVLAASSPLLISLIQFLLESIGGGK